MNVVAVRTWMQWKSNTRENERCLKVKKCMRWVSDVVVYESYYVFGHA